MRRLLVTAVAAGTAAAALLAGPGAASRAAVPACRGGALTGSFTLIPGSPGAGNVVYALRLRNRPGGRVCFVSGIPSLRLLGRLGVPRPTRVFPSRPGGGLAVRVALRPGGWASASARFSPDVPGPGEGQLGQCERTSYRLRVGFPNGTALVVPVTPPTPVCSHGRMSVSILVGGRTPRQGG